MNKYILTEKCYYFEIDGSVDLDFSKLDKHKSFESIDELYGAASNVLNCRLDDVLGKQLYIDKNNCWQDFRRISTDNRLINVADFINNFEM